MTLLQKFSPEKYFALPGITAGKEAGKAAGEVVGEAAGETGGLAETACFTRREKSLEASDRSCEQAVHLV